MATATRGRKAKPGSLDSEGAGAESLALDVLQQDAATFEQSVRQLDDFSQERLDSMKPGGVANLDQSVRGWYEYVKQLVLWFASGPKQPTTMRWTPQQMQDLSDALSESPLYVPMTDGVRRGVFPKGDYAMHRISLIDQELQLLAPRWVALENAKREAARTLSMPRALIDACEEHGEYKTQLEREFIWIVTHPSADVPWPEDGQWEHTPPDWTRAYSSTDMLLLRAAYIDVNYQRLAMIAERTHALAGSAQGESATQAQFMGVMATELGIAPRTLSHEWSRGMLTAMAFTKWEATAKAEADAKAAA